MNIKLLEKLVLGAALSLTLSISSQDPDPATTQKQIAHLQAAVERLQRRTGILPTTARVLTGCALLTIFAIPVTAGLFPEKFSAGVKALERKIQELNSGRQPRS